MGKLTDRLKDYFENNSKEVLEKDWERGGGGQRQIINKTKPL